MVQKKHKGYLVLVHWDRDEAEQLAAPLEAAGWQVELGNDRVTRWKADPPTAVVISLRRLPSHGREVADALWQSKWGRTIPIVFFDGAVEKVEAIRRRFPAAYFASWPELPGVLRQLQRAEEAKRALS